MGGASAIRSPRTAGVEERGYKHDTDRARSALISIEGMHNSLAKNLKSIIPLLEESDVKTGAKLLREKKSADKNKYFESTDFNASHVLFRSILLKIQ